MSTCYVLPGSGGGKCFCNETENFKVQCPKREEQVGAKRDDVGRMLTCENVVSQVGCHLRARSLKAHKYNHELDVLS